MGQLRGLFRFQNNDSTRDLNDRISGLVLRGVMDPGAAQGNAAGLTTPHVSRVPGQLAVNVDSFMAVGQDGMVVVHDTPPLTMLALAPSMVQYILVKTVYMPAGPADTVFEVMSVSSWNALVPTEQAKRIILAKVTTLLTDVPSDASIDLRENNIVDRGSRNFIRGVVPAAVDLPTNTGVLRVTAGDVYLAISQRQFYRFDGAAWQTVTDGSVNIDIQRHKGVNGPTDLLAGTVTATNGLTTITAGVGTAFTTFPNILVAGELVRFATDVATYTVAVAPAPTATTFSITTTYTGVTGSGKLVTRTILNVQDGGTAISRDTGEYPAHLAKSIKFVAGGTLQSTNVQEALAEVALEKVQKTGDTMTGPLSISTTSVAFTSTSIDSLAGDFLSGPGIAFGTRFTGGAAVGAGTAGSGVTILGGSGGGAGIGGIGANIQGGFGTTAAGGIGAVVSGGNGFGTAGIGATFQGGSKTNGGAVGLTAIGGAALTSGDGAGGAILTGATGITTGTDRDGGFGATMTGGDGVAGGVGGFGAIVQGGNATGGGSEGGHGITSIGGNGVLRGGNGLYGQGGTGTTGGSGAYVQGSGGPSVQTSGDSAGIQAFGGLGPAAGYGGHGIHATGGNAGNNGQGGHGGLFKGGVTTVGNTSGGSGVNATGGVGNGSGDGGFGGDLTAGAGGATGFGGVGLRVLAGNGASGGGYGIESTGGNGTAGDTRGGVGGLFTGGNRSGIGTVGIGVAALGEGVSEPAYNASQSGAGIYARGSAVNGGVGGWFQGGGTNGTAVYAQAAGSGTGVLGNTGGTSGIAVYGSSTHTTSIGVYGTTSSATGIAGKFEVFGGVGRTALDVTGNHIWQTGARATYYLDAPESFGGGGTHNVAINTTDQSSIGLVLNVSTGEVTVTYAGDYVISYSLSVRSNAGALTDLMSAYVHINAGLYPSSKSTQSSLATSTGVMSASVTAFVAAGQKVRVKLDSFGSVDVLFGSFSLQRIPATP